MEIKVNDYVRTKKGIKKIYKIDSNKTKWKYLFKLKEQDGDGCIDLGFLCDEEIIKSSPRIIDLIEVGDYVNGREIDFISKEGVYSDYNNAEYYYFEKEDIKSIVTKEMFEQMEYKVN